MPKKEPVILILWRLLYPILIFYGVELVLETGYTMICSAAFVAADASLAADEEALYEMVLNEVYDKSLYLTGIRSLILIPIYILLMVQDGKRDRRLGQEKHYAPYAKGWLALLPVAGFTAALGFNQMIDIMDLQRFSPRYQAASEIIYSGSVWLTILVSAVLAPVVEEFLFRGLVYRRLRKHAAPVVCALVSSLLFGLVHGNLVQFVYAFLVGMLICWVYEKFKTIWAPILFHAGANLIAVILTEFVPAFGGGMSLGSLMLLTVGWLAATFMLLWLIHRRVNREIGE